MINTAKPKLFITKLRMALLPSLQESLKRSNDNRTTSLRTREKEAAHLSLGNKYLMSKGSRADEQCDKSNGLNTKTRLQRGQSDFQIPQVQSVKHQWGEDGN